MAKTPSNVVLGTVTSVSGEVKATAPDGTTRVLQVGDKVFLNDTILTSAQGTATLQLSGGHSVECQSDGRITLNEITLSRAGIVTAPTDTDHHIAPSVVAGPERAFCTVGTIKVVVGDVRVVGIDGVPRIAYAGEKVSASEAIVTSATGLIQVQLDNGSFVDLGRDSQIVLDNEVLGGGPLASAACPPTQDVAALQRAIAAGADPTEVAKATAAGGAPAAGGGAESGGGHTFVIIDQADTTGQITSGFQTEGPGILGFPVEPQPPLGPNLPRVTVQVQIETSTPPTTPGNSPSSTFVTALNAASIVEGTSETTKAVHFVITLDAASDSDVAVSYQVAPGTAQSPDDFQGILTGTVTLPAGETQVIVPIQIVQDHLVEPNENFSVILTNATNATINPDASSVVITIIDDDHAPIAQPDSNWTEVNGTDVSGNVLQALAHVGAPSGTYADTQDTDPDGDTVAVDAVNGTPANVGQSVAGAHGTLVLDSDGSYTYALNSNDLAVQALDDAEKLTDTFTYTISDGVNASTPATLTINIFGTNDAPVALSDTNWISEDAIDASGNVLQTLLHSGAPSGSFSDVADIDVDIEPLAVDSVNGLIVNVGHAVTGLYGTLTLNPDGSYTYTLNNSKEEVQALDDGEMLVDTFSYTATDGTATSNPATLSITIFGTNDAPVALADTNWVIEDGNDASGNVLQTLLHSGAPAGSFGDVADTDADTADANALKVVRIAAGANEAGGDNVPASTIAVDGIAISGKYGILTMGADGSYSYSLDKSNSAVNALADNQQLSDEVFSYTVSDGTAITTATLKITIFGTNDGPLALDDSNSISENTASITSVVPGVLVNDTDVDSTTLMVTTVRTGAEAGSGTAGTLGSALAGEHGALTLFGDGHYTYALNNADPAVDALNAGQSITDVFTYTMSDGSLTDQAQLTIIITGTNDGPVAVNDTNSISENTPSITGTVLGVLANDTDVDTPHDQLVVTAVRTGTEAGSGTVGTLGTSLTGEHGTLTLFANGHYTYALNNADPAVDALNAGQSITDVFTYTMSDGSLTDQAQLTITITGTNDGPVAVNDTNSINEDTPSIISTVATNVLFNDSDVDTPHDELVVTAVRTGSEAGSGTAGALNAALEGQYGKLTLQSDGSYIYSLFTQGENTAAYNAVQGLNGMSTPLQEFFTYTMTDGLVSDTAQLTISITGTNDGPLALDDSNSINEDWPSITSTVSTNVLGNDTSIDTAHELLSVTGVRTGAEGGTGTVGALNATLDGQYGKLTLQADGSYVYALYTQSENASAYGAVQALNVNSEPLHDFFTYTMTDGVLTDTAQLTISITGTNDRPVAVDDTDSISENTASITGVVPGVLGNDTDVDSSTLTVTAVRTGNEAGSGTAGTLGNALTGGHGTLTLFADGHYTYALNNADPAVNALNVGQSINDVFTYTMSDGSLSDQAQLTITITGTNDAPTIAAPNVSGTVYESGLISNPLPLTAAASFGVSSIDSTNGTLSEIQGDIRSTATGIFSVSDVDNNVIMLSQIQFQPAGASSFTTIDATGMSATVDTGHGILTLDSADSGHTWNWTYQLYKPVTDIANVAESEIIKVAMTDGVTQSTAQVIAEITIVDDVPRDGAASGIISNVSNAVLIGDSGIVYGADSIGPVPTISAATLPTGWTATQVDTTHIALDSATAHASMSLDPVGQYTFTVLDPIDATLVPIPLNSSTIKAGGPTDVPITVDFTQSDIDVTFSAPTGIPNTYDDLNISTEGIGIGNQLIDSEHDSPLETLRMDFTVSGTPFAVSTVGITVDKFGGSDALTFKTYDTNGGLVDTGTVASQTTNQGDYTFYINNATVDDSLANLFSSIELSFNPGDTKTAYVVTTLEIQKTINPDDAMFTFNVAGADGDGDTATSLIAINVDGNPAAGATSGADTLSGTSVDDILVGGDGADSISGGAGNDSLFGSNGNDVINGNTGDDFLSGDSGNDTIVGGPGNDVLVGGPGSDTFVFTETGSPDTVTDFAVAPAAAGGDILDFSSLLPGVDLQDPDLGDYIKLESVGSNAVISIDADGAGGGAAPAPVVTLDGAAGATLLQLLQNDQIVV